MAWLYLIQEKEKEQTKYKIGVTRMKDPNKRLEILQTGNPNVLEFMALFETKYPFKLETMMHAYYRNKNVLNEWFDLSQEDIENFLCICELNNKKIPILMENPFF